MILERIALLGSVGTAIVVGGLCIALQAGKMAAEKDRDAAVNWGVNTCTAVGVPWRDDPTKPGKFIKKADWGKDCDTRIRWLASFYANAVTAAANAVTTHDTEQTAKAATDRPAARRSASRLIAAEQKLETAHAAVQNGQYGRDWIDGLSDAFGLRDSIEADAPASPGSGDAAGASDAGPAGMPEAPSTPPG